MCALNLRPAFWPKCAASNGCGSAIIEAGRWSFLRRRCGYFEMPLKPFAEYEELARAAHGHLCAGQILGLRMALCGLRLLELDDPTGKHRKRLITYVEIDRCMTDAVGVVTGCRLGKRALKFRDFGKAAATFCDLEAQRAVRVAARESTKQPGASGRCGRGAARHGKQWRAVLRVVRRQQHCTAGER